MQEGGVLDWWRQSNAVLKRRADFVGVMEQEITSNEVRVALAALPVRCLTVKRSGVKRFRVSVNNNNNNVTRA